MAEKGERSLEIYKKLLAERIIFITDEIDDEQANVVTAQLLYLQFEDKTKDIHLYLNSPGGSVTASLAIYDTMELVENDIATYVIGQAAGTALLLLAAGTKGKRYALPHARLAFTPLWRDPQAPVKDAAVEADEIARLRKAIFEIFARHTGQSLDFLARAHERINTHTSKDSLTLGLIDQVLAELPPMRG